MQEVFHSPTLSASDLIRQVFVSAPYDFPYYEDGTLHKTTTGNPIPLADGSSGNKSTKKTRLESKFSARWNLPFITKGLYMSGYFAYDYYTTYRKDLSNPYDIYTLDASTGNMLIIGMRQVLLRCSSSLIITTNCWNNEVVPVSSRLLTYFPVDASSV